MDRTRDPGPVPAMIVPAALGQFTPALPRWLTGCLCGWLASWLAGWLAGLLARSSRELAQGGRHEQWDRCFDRNWKWNWPSQWYGHPTSVADNGGDG